MNKIPTAEEFFRQHIQRGVNNTHSNYLKTAIAFANVVRDATLKAASEKATCKDSNVDPYNEVYVVDKQSILNAYPKENIL